MRINGKSGVSDCVAWFIVLQFEYFILESADLREPEITLLIREVRGEWPDQFELLQAKYRK